MYSFAFMINEYLLKEFGDRIKQLRLEKSYGQEKLSSLTGFHRTYIGMIERGERNISISNMAVFAKAFDLIYVPEMVGKIADAGFVQTYLEDIILVELKTTKKYLPENPKGFFFGATENEFNFGKILGSRFRFCFVSLNEKGSSYAFLTLVELEERIKNRRIQYQINL
jgi:transcriptional regulator with XRE-family HTH domain